MEVISVHVPKTAGTTFGKLLRTIYRPEQVYMDYDDKVMNPDSQFNVHHDCWQREAAVQVRAIAIDYSVVHGHFAIFKYAQLLRLCRNIAWVRHPVAWLVSLYYFWKRIPKADHPLVCRLQDEGLSLLEFAEQPLARNRMSHVYLNGLDLEDFCFVGIQEHFQADLRDLTHLMGWPDSEVGVENSSPEPRYHALMDQHLSDKRLIGKLQSLNEDDMELYERALGLRTRRLRQARARQVWGPVEPTVNT
jgi:Sulfotransferase family